MGCVRRPITQGFAGSGYASTRDLLKPLVRARTLGFRTRLRRRDGAAGRGRRAGTRAWRTASKPARRTKALGNALEHFLHSASTISGSVAPYMGSFHIDQ